MEESEGVPLVRVRHQRNASCIIHELRITRLVIGGLGRMVDATESVVLSLSLPASHFDYYLVAGWSYESN